MLRLLFIAAICGMCADANPILTVINKLENEKDNMIKFLKEGKTVYEKFHCWFKNEEKDLGNSIDSSTKAISSAQATIATQSANLADAQHQLKNCQGNKAEAAKNRADNDQNRQQKKMEFNKFVQDNNALQTGLKNAIIVLKKQQGKMLIQTQEKKAVQTFFSSLFSKNSDIASVENQQEIEKFFDASSLLQGPSDRDDYESRSGAIFGMLTNMQENADRDMKNAEEEWDSSLTEMNGMANAYEAQTEEANACIAAQTESSTKAPNAITKNEEKESTESDSLDASRVRLNEVRKKYQDETNTWEESKKDMEDQKTAIVTAIGILDSDTLINSKGGSFLQRNVNIAGLMQTRVGNEAFKSVYDAIDKHVERVKARQTEDRERRASCEALQQEYDNTKANNDADKTAAENEKSSLKTNIHTLEGEIETSQGEIKTKKDSLAEEIEDHNDATNEANANIKEQVDALPIIEKAKQVLAAKFSGALIQAPAPAGTVRKEAAGTAIMALMDTIMSDMQHVIKVNRKALAQGEADMAESKQDATMVIQTQTSAVNAAQNTVADHNKSVGEVEDQLDEIAQTDYNLDMQAQQLKAECTDKFLNAGWFDKRRKAQDNEISAMKSAKQTLQESV